MIFLLIYFPAGSLLVYRKATHFYALILYLVTFLKVFIKAKSFLMECLVSFIISDHVVCK